MGDATNLVIVLTGELLKKAEDLLRMGLKTSDIVLGYEKAQGIALKCLDGEFFLLYSLFFNYICHDSWCDILGKYFC